MNKLLPTFDNGTDEHGILSKDVDCPWCDAKVGQPCRTQGDQSRFDLATGKERVHLGRIKEQQDD